MTVVKNPRFGNLDKGSNLFLLFAQRFLLEDFELQDEAVHAGWLSSSSLLFLIRFVSTNSFLSPKLLLVSTGAPWLQLFTSSAIRTVVPSLSRNHFAR